MTSDAIPDFIAAMEAAGIVPAEPIADRLGNGELIRFRCEGDKPGRRNAWAVLHTDERPAGAFGCYRLGITDKWRDGSRKVMTLAERREFAARCETARTARANEKADRQASAAIRACRIWEAARAPLPGHPYLTRKGMDGEGLRQAGSTLIVPLRDIDGRLWNVQRIEPDGTKLYLKFARVDGLFWSAGNLASRSICIGEGIATMAAIRRASGNPVVAAMTYGNLDAVARSIHGRHPAADIIICADDDTHLIDHPKVRRNVGMEAARAAAVAVGARLAIPPKG